MFRVTSAHHQKSQIVLLHHLVKHTLVGDWLPGQEFPLDRHDSHPPECVIPVDVLKEFGPPDDEHLLLETCKGMKKKFKKSASSWLLTRIASRCTVNKKIHFLFNR
jgi:hypothetical protein